MVICGGMKPNDGNGDMAAVVRAMGHPGVSEETGQLREENESRQTWLVGSQSHSDKGLRKLQNRLRYGRSRYSR